MDTNTDWRTYIEETGQTELPAAPPDTVVNGSFEEGDGSAPDGWQLASGELGVSTRWETAGGVDGGRCLWITPRGGGASWRARPIPVTPGAEYVFRCAIKRDGNRHWAHACRASWLSLVFLDADGKPIRPAATTVDALVPVRCRKTADWVDAWRHVVAPPEARHLEIGFQILRGEPKLDDAYGFRKFWHGDIDTGQWWIDDVRLERLPVEAEPAYGRLTIRVPDGGTRLRITGASGEAVMPEAVATYSHGGGCFHALRDTIEVPLTPGQYTVEAMRGFQRRPFRAEVKVIEGELTVVEPTLPRIADGTQRGWYEGDHHVHLSFHGSTRHPLMTINDLYRVARGEGLDFVSFCGELVDQHAYADWRDRGRPADARPDGAFEAPDFVASVSHEVTQDLLGHVCLVNAPGHIAPGHPWWIAPTNAHIVETVLHGDRHGTQGAVVMAHPYDSLSADNLLQVLADPTITCLERELPVDAALGYAHTMDFLAVEPPADLDLRFRDYFRLLNLGLRIGVSGASDAYVDQGTEIVGSLRTVVRAEAFTMNAIAQAYRAQRTYTTNGPVLEFGVNGASPGDTTMGPGARIEARAYSNWGLARLEVIANGEVVADAMPDSDGWARIDAEIRLERSGWLIARCWGPAHSALNTQSVASDQHAVRGQWAVTSPVYFGVSGKPIAPKREDADYFIRWIDASCEAIRGRRGVLEGQGPYGPVMKDEDVRDALDLFGRARAVYEGLGA
ncbi:MAG TPA: CehA/McbA family metallohydrolase [Candidatus Hydrogenedentes bacterium]|nr:CehA/McbA family metallohydrolase [Candidatus Hydrogenedentota bacterium]HPG68747.1 CehA/McbA family metallohydrolase [Candidatus Hydrogenedentota bacterium]